MSFAPPCPSPSRPNLSARKACFQLSAVLLALSSTLSSSAATATARPIRQSANNDAPRNLRTCVFEQYPFVQKVDNAEGGDSYTGTAITYFNLLLESSNATKTFIPWNGTVPELVDAISTGGSAPCDIAVGAFERTNARTDKVDFVWPFGNDAFQMVTRKSELRPQGSDSIFFIFRTFSTGVWLLIILGVIFHSFGTLLFVSFDLPTPYDDEPNTPLSANGQPGPIQTCFKRVRAVVSVFPSAIVSSYAHLIGHPFHESQKPQKMSFHRYAWLVLGLTAGLFLVTVYEASLTVLLFEGSRQSLFRTYEDMTHCSINASRIAYINNSASSDFWDTRIDIDLNQEACGWTEKVGYPVDDIAMGFDRIRDGTVDYFFGLQSAVMMFSNENCNEFGLVGEPFFFTTLALMVPKDVDRALKDILDKQTRLLRESDAFPSTRAEAFNVSCDDAGEATVTFRKMSLFFLMFFIAWFLLLSYRIFFLWKQSRRQESSSQEASTANNATPPLSTQSRHLLATESVTDASEAQTTRSLDQPTSNSS